MRLRDHPDWHAVVAAHWGNTTGRLLAFGEPCISIRDDELAAIRDNRVLVDLDASRLSSWSPPDSWMLGVILCPKDDIMPLVDWLKGSDADADRIHFYAHPDAEPFELLQPWADAGLPMPKVDEGIASWRSLHKRFGLDLSVRILADWG